MSYPIKENESILANILLIMTAVAVAVLIFVIDDKTFRWIAGSFLILILFQFLFSSIKRKKKI